MLEGILTSNGGALILPKKIKIKYFDENIPKLSRNKTQDWIDLRSTEDIELRAGDYKLIPLGVAMELPTGYEAHIVPRSSTFKNYGIIQTNGQGIIDEFYRGDNDQWFMPVFATRTTVINKHDRICQFRIIEKMQPVIFEEVLGLTGVDRGGHGSSGVK